jgi:hypothetical protein
MIFSHEYTKLKKSIFTTIRKNAGYYQVGKWVRITTPEQKFSAVITNIIPIKKEQIDDNVAQMDADCDAEQLIDMLEQWYGPKYNDFILIYMEKGKHKNKSKRFYDPKIIKDNDTVQKKRSQQ